MSINELRPTKLKDYIGQENLKEQIHVSIEASKKRKKQFPHILFFGGAGLGKTSISSVIANEMGSDIIFANAANIQKPADLISYIVNLNENDFLFIDEIHRLKREFEEMLYTVMEDYRVDIVIKKGTDMEPISISLPKFTLVGATTLKGGLTQPLIDRFGLKLEIKEYSINELTKIIMVASKKLGANFKESALYKIAECSRGTPRKALQTLDRVIDFAVVECIDLIDEAYVERILKKIKVDHNGLEETDIHILRLLHEEFEGRPVGLNNLAAASGQQKDTLETTIEPFLIRNKFIIRTSRGRKITNKGIEVLTKKT
jgi:holliday junction DNA helicase RuvB